MPSKSENSVANEILFEMHGGSSKGNNKMSQSTAKRPAKPVAKKPLQKKKNNVCIISHSYNNH